MEFEQSTLLDALIELEKKRAAASLNQDKDILQALMVEEYMEVNYAGRLPKQQILQNVFPSVTLKRFETTDHRF